MPNSEKDLNKFDDKYTAIILLAIIYAFIISPLGIYFFESIISFIGLAEPEKEIEFFFKEIVEKILGLFFFAPLLLTFLAGVFLFKKSSANLIF